MLSDRLHQLLREATGLDLTPQNSANALKHAMRLAGENGRDQFILQLLREPQRLQPVIEQVVVPESWFFRDPEAFVAAGQIVAATLAQQQRPLRILSVPCASGEEPYSIAMCLLELGIAEQVSIEAIDISAQVIERARRGHYQRNAFRSADLAFRERFFTPSGNGHQLRAEVMRMVEFRQANLLQLDESTALARYDLIFCRNLLIYFDGPTCRRAVHKLEGLLTPGGTLFAGYAEMAVFSQNGFVVAPFARAFALRKKATAGLTKEMPAAGPALAKPAVNRPAHPGAPAQILPRVAPPAGTAPARAATRGKAEAAGKVDLAALLAQAHLAADRGQLAAAEADFRRYLTLAPDSAEACFMLGLLLEQGGKNDAAQVSLKQAIYLDPDHYDALCHLAALTEHEGKIAAAEQLRQRAARVARRQAGAAK